MHKLLYALPLMAAIAHAQTANVPAVPVNGSCTIPASSAATVKISGRTYYVSIPQQQGKVTGTTTQTSAPIDLNGYTGAISCSLASDGTFVINPDQSITITGLTCSLKKAQ